jgi:formylmethanofuran dehydrogenase subunit E
MRLLCNDEVQNVLNEFKLEYLPFTYTGNTTKIQFYCKKCGQETVRTFRQIQCGRIFCNDCVVKDIHEKQKLTQHESERRLTELGIIFKPFVYVNNKTRIEYQCKNCGKWKNDSYRNMFFINHLCKMCNYNNICQKQRYTIAEIEKQLNNLGIEYKTPIIYKNAWSIIEYKCKRCGELKSNTLHNIKSKGGTLCSKCSNAISLMERNIQIYLNNLSIKYIFNYRGFDWLKKERRLELDFYLPEHNIAIECQGGQHFEPVKRWGGEQLLASIQRRDSLKKHLCERHGIKLFYINYNDDVDTVLNAILSEIMKKTAKNVLL